MPFSAYRDKAKTILVDADHTTLSDKGKIFYCKTKGCNAEYCVVNAGIEEDAFFRRRSSSPLHISVNCARNSMVFDEHKYSEAMFSEKNLYGYILKHPSTPSHVGTTGTKHAHIGGSSGVRTLRTFYELVCDRGVSSFYNGINLSNIFANDENFARYETGLIGCHIVEASYYCMADPETLLFNYPCDFGGPHIIIAIQFVNNHKKCLEYHNKFMTHSHTDPIIICGDWEEWNLCDAVCGKTVIVKYRCNYVSGRQFFDPN